MGILLLALLFNFSAAAQDQGAIVYVDLNNPNAYAKNPPANDEITALRKTAKKNNLTLVIIPSAKPDKPFGPAELCRGLTALASSGKKIHSLVISGHDGGGNFGGTIGTITYPDLDTILKMPVVSQDVRQAQGVYLWGCYSNTVAEDMKFNQLIGEGIIAGFDDKSPLNGDARNSSVLESLVGKQLAIVNEGNATQVLNTINKLDRLKLAVAVVQSCSNIDYLFWDPGKSSFTPKALDTSQCPANMPDIKAAIATIKKYRFCGLSSDGGGFTSDGAPAAAAPSDCSYFLHRKAQSQMPARKQPVALDPADCEDIPPDYPSSDPRFPGEMRKAYSVLRANEQCIGEPNGEIPHEDLSETILLVKEEEVMKDYRTQFRSELENACKALPGCGENPPKEGVNGKFLSDFLDGKNVSRSTWLTGVAQLASSKVLQEELAAKGVTGVQASTLWTLENLAKFPLASFINSSDAYVLYNDPTCEDVTWTDAWQGKSKNPPCAFDGMPLEQEPEMNVSNE